MILLVLLLAGCASPMPAPVAPPPMQGDLRSMWAEHVREVNDTHWRAFNEELRQPDTKRLLDGVPPRDVPRWR